MKICIFQNRKTKRYKWLSLEIEDGGSIRYVCESCTDTVGSPSQKPSDVVSNPGSLIDYDSAVNRICEEGYDIVTQR